MLDWRSLLFRPNHQYIKNLREVREDKLYFDSLTRGTLVSGNPGTGKTTWKGMELIRYALAYPTRPIIVFDASGSLTDEFIELYHSLPRDQYEALDRRFILDMPGHDQWVVPKPFFSDMCGLSEEDQVQKAVNILEELNYEKIQRNPTMASAITETAPNLFRLIQVIKDDFGTSWQLTEAKRLLIAIQKNGLLDRALDKYGHAVPSARWYLRAQVMRKGMSGTSREARTSSLIGALGVIESKSLRARYGYYKPGITMREIIDGGLIYFVDGSLLSNQKNAQAWVFWDEYASLKAVINKRRPHDKREKRVLLVIDEVYQLFDIKGMAREIGQISAYYRSRKLQLIMIIQAHWQLSDDLKEQIWNLGNLVTFSLDNLNDAYKFAQQVFEYEVTREKLPATSEMGQPLIESDRGQYLQEANWLQNLGWRQIVMRRYLNERDKEGFVSFVKKTREKPLSKLSDTELPRVKERLLARRAVEVRRALEIINKRKIPAFKKQRPTVKP